MRLISFFSVGILFGIIMTKSEAVSWFRIHEMFRFESFHMYGIIGTAVVLGAIIIAAMKRFKIKTLSRSMVSYTPMALSVKRHLLAGSIFGLGWALIGACPGPMFVLMGQGFGIMAVVLASATLGTYAYGIFQNKLPH
ncbi:MAG TPA: YeeE/YedE thiosulfate transporter family protein [Saprospiraceae bacterium]|nr:YeeE/YedE thiosulfate transporter family protein [Saprospiraceae bacterium]HMQ83262.1 YeeE/YedE thiosulfate transporter family protein [Saprospiraceae bacterium]